jgi:2,5-diketo-D-gluconate reductase A
MTATLSSFDSKPHVAQIIDPRQVPYVKPTLSLNDGTLFPRIGLGTRAMNDLDVQAAVSAALQMGYRLVDTASDYGNELGVGRGIRASGVPRGQIVLTSTLRGSDHGYNDTLRAFDASVERLGTNYIDLYLLPPQERTLCADSWRALIRLKAEGLVRSIGVSNFLPQEIYRLVSESGVRPSLNQIEIHPAHPQNSSRSWHARNNIHIQSCSPLSRGRLLSQVSPRNMAEGSRKLSCDGTFSRAWWRSPSRRTRGECV